MDAAWDDLRRALRAGSQAVAPPAASRAAVALVLRDGPVGVELLFIRRAEHPLDPWSGQVAFPGGRREPGDSDLLATAVRETAEEVGLDLAQAELLGALDEVRAMARMRPLDLTILPFVFRLPGGAEARPGPEVESAHWLALAPLLGEDLRSTLDYPHEGASLQFPCLRVDELVIWGLTYRMLLSLGGRLAPAAREAR